VAKTCEGHPHRLVKLFVDCVLDKDHATHEQVAQALGLSIDSWKQFYHNYREGDVERIPTDLRNLVPEDHLRFLTGFTDDQLNILESAIDIPVYMAKDADEQNPLLKDIIVLTALGVMMEVHYHTFRRYTAKVIW